MAALTLSAAAQRYIKDPMSYQKGFKADNTNFTGHFFDQNLDHFNDNDTRTFLERYWIND